MKELGCLTTRFYHLSEQETQGARGGEYGLGNRNEAIYPITRPWRMVAYEI